MASIVIPPQDSGKMTVEKAVETLSQKKRKKQKEKKEAAKLAAKLLRAKKQKKRKKQKEKQRQKKEAAMVLQKHIRSWFTRRREEAQAVINANANAFFSPDKQYGYSVTFKPSITDWFEVIGPLQYGKKILTTQSDVYLCEYGQGPAFEKARREAIDNGCDLSDFAPKELKLRMFSSALKKEKANGGGNKERLRRLEKTIQRETAKTYHYFLMVAVTENTLVEKMNAVTRRILGIMITVELPEDFIDIQLLYIFKEHSQIAPSLYHNTIEGFLKDLAKRKNKGLLVERSLPTNLENSSSTELYSNPLLYAKQYDFRFMPSVMCEKERFVWDANQPKAYHPKQPKAPPKKVIEAAIKAAMKQQQAVPTDEELLKKKRDGQRRRAEEQENCVNEADAFVRAFQLYNELLKKSYGSKCKLLELVIRDAKECMDKKNYKGAIKIMLEADERIVMFAAVHAAKQST